jgi:ATP-dependent protease ClpP protease subunit
VGSQSGLCNKCWQKQKYDKSPIGKCSFCNKDRKIKIANPATCQACYTKNNPITKEKHRVGNIKQARTLKSMLSTAIRTAEIRGLPWKITKSELGILREKPCFYCGGSLPPTGHGLDRILNDKKIGYTLENVVPCCATCNMVRGDKLSASEMIVAMQAVKEQRRISFENLHSLGYHVDSRTIFIFGEINTEMSKNVNAAMEIMENINFHAPVIVRVMSEGGNWFDGLAIYDRLKNSNCPIHMIGTGMVASTATAIFQAGDIRELTPNAIFVLHDGTEGFEGEAKSFEAWGETSKKSRQRLYEIYSEKSGKPTSFWQTLCLKDTILDSKQVIDFKLADSIQLPIKNKKVD